MNKRSFLLMLVMMILQIFLYNHFDGSKADRTGYMIVSGVDANSNFRLLGSWYLFFATLSFLHIGYIRKYITEYGIYSMLRQKSRVKPGVRRIFKLLFLIVVVCSIQIFLSIVFSYVIGETKEFFTDDLGSLFQMLGLYVLSNFVLIYIQLVLELYFTEQVSLLGINIYVLLSVTLGGVLLSGQNRQWVLYLLIPNFGMYERTNFIESMPHAISPINAYVTLAIITIILSVLFHKRLKKMDLI